MFPVTVLSLGPEDCGSVPGANVSQGSIIVWITTNTLLSDHFCTQTRQTGDVLHTRTCTVKGDSVQRGGYITFVVILDKEGPTKFLMYSVTLFYRNDS